MHGAKAAWVRSEAVSEAFDGAAVWTGQVEVFVLEGHPKATRCFAWEEPPAEESGKARVFAVLAIPPIRSAADAVRASIVARTRRT
jgi:hypothetical protein